MCTSIAVWHVREYIIKNEGDDGEDKSKKLYQNKKAVHHAAAT